MAGVPFEAVGDLATGESSALARRLIAAEHARDEVIIRLKATFESGEHPFSGAAYRALRKAIRTHSPPENPPGEHPPLFYEFAQVAREIATLERELEQQLKSEIESARVNLLGFSRRFLPRYLVFGSSAMRAAVDKVLHPAATSTLPKRDRSIRKIEQTLLLYLQRVAAKNDTFSEFGPSSWGRIHSDEAAVLFQPKPGIIARDAYLERWIAHAVAAHINAELASTDASGPAALMVPALDAHAFDSLVQDVERWAESPLRRKWLAPLKQLNAMPARFVQAVSPNDREDALRETREMLKDIGAERMPSDRFLYSAANPIGEECLRESGFAVREDLVQVLETDGAPWIDLWRDTYAFVASRVASGLRQVMEKAAPAKNAMPLPQFLQACAAANLPLQGPGLIALAVMAFQEVKAAVVERLRPVLDREVYELTPEDCHVIRRDFQYPHFDEYTYPSADLQLAASSLEAVKSGDFQWIISELHPPIALLHHGVYWGCPDPPILNEALAATTFGRPNFHFGFFAADFTSHTAVRSFDAMPELTFFVAPHRSHPGWKRVAPAEAEVFVDPDSGDVVLRKMSSREFLGSFARAWVIPLGFHPFQFTVSPHTPRLQCGKVVVQRRAWTVALDEFDVGEYPQRPRALMVAVERLRFSKGLPRYVYIRPTERALRRSGAEGRDKDTKPVFIDLESYLFLEIFHRWLVKAGELELTEMLPAPDQLIWQEEDGHHTFEMRTMIVPRK